MKLVVTIIFFAMIRFGHAQELNISLFDGVFISTNDGGAMQEVWTRLNDSTAKGQSILVAVNGDTTVLEQVMIKKIKSSWYYAPTVPDQNQGKEILFQLINSENNSYTFENKNHDFPQRIIYSFPNKKQVNARIEGDVKGELKIEYFQYSRR